MSVRLITIGKWVDDKVPYFSLKGDWLAEAGFSVGRKAVVEEIKGQIVIKLVEVEEV